MLLKVYLVFFSCLLQDWAGQSMLNKPTENILKLNLVAFNLSLPWQNPSALPIQPGLRLIEWDATELLLQGLNSRVKSGPKSVAKATQERSTQKRKRERKSRPFFSRPSQFAASESSCNQASHGCKHRSRTLWPFHNVSGWRQKGGLHQCVLVHSCLFCFYFKSPGKYLFRACRGLVTFL